MGMSKCACCGGDGAELEHQPIQRYEGHIKLTFWEHRSIDGSAPDKQVAMCRKCAIALAKDQLEVADPEVLKFYA